MSKKIKEIINSHFFRPSWYSVIINPYFVSRRGLLNKIKKFSRDDFSGKVILDVGCGIKPYKNLFNSNSYIGIDIDYGGHTNQAKVVDKFYDGVNIPYGDNSFDVIICTEVMEHVKDPEKLLSEISRVLKSGGLMFFSMPFVWNEHEVPYDFQRFTSFKHQSIFEKADLNIQSIKGTGGVFRVCGQLISAFIFERLFVKNKLLKLLSAVILCFPIQLIFVLLDSIFKNSWITLDYVIIAKKL